MPKRLKDVDSGERLMMIALALRVGVPTVIVLMFVEWKMFPGMLGALVLPDLFIAVIVVRIVWHMLAGVARVANVFIMPNSIPAVRGYSEQDSLVVQGRVAEAAASYRRLVAGDPLDLPARLRLAALLAADPSNAAAAERCFIEVRRLHPTAQQSWVVDNGLIDLYRANGEREKLKHELARFARGHDGTDAGRQAQRYLDQLEDGG